MVIGHLFRLKRVGVGIQYGLRIQVRAKLSRCVLSAVSRKVLGTIFSIRAIKGGHNVVVLIYSQGRSFKYLLVRGNGFIYQVVSGNNYRGTHRQVHLVQVREAVRNGQGTNEAFLRPQGRYAIVIQGVRYGFYKVGRIVHDGRVLRFVFRVTFNGFLFVYLHNEGASISVVLSIQV